jgi:hypothetical protein
MKQKPFGKGSFRVAYYAQLKVEGKILNLVAKVPIVSIASERDAEILDNIKIQVLISLFPSLFATPSSLSVTPFRNPLPLPPLFLSFPLVPLNDR